MFDKTVFTTAQFIAFLKDANVTGATVDIALEKVTLHLDEGSPAVSFSIDGILLHYVKKELGKGLSTNDFTNALLGRLNEITDQKQADWNETNPSHITYIHNKPTLYNPSSILQDLLGNLTIVAGNLHYAGTPVDSVTPDWSESNANSKSFIANKPDVYYPNNQAILDLLTDNGSGVIRYNGVVISGEKSDWNITNPTDPSFIANKPILYSPANQDVLDELATDINGQLTLNGLSVATELTQPDWNEQDTSKVWFIRNKPNVYLPDMTLRDTLNGFGESATTGLTWRSNEVAMIDDLILEVNKPSIYGIITTISITPI